MGERKLLRIKVVERSRQQKGRKFEDIIISPLYKVLRFKEVLYTY